MALEVYQDGVADELLAMLRRTLAAQRAAPDAPRFRAVGPTGVPLLSGPSCSADTVIPSGGYGVVRVLWPWTLDEDVAAADDLPASLSWAERSVIAGKPFGVGTSLRWGGMPNIPGAPDDRTRDRLREILARHTRPGQRLWFAYDSIATVMTGCPTTVLSGTFAEVDRFRLTFTQQGSTEPVIGPSHWWATPTGGLASDPGALDQWTVGTDYDACWTDISGPPALLDDLLADSELESHALV